MKKFALFLILAAALAGSLSAETLTLTLGNLSSFNPATNPTGTTTVTAASCSGCSSYAASSFVGQAFTFSVSPLAIPNYGPKSGSYSTANILGTTLTNANGTYITSPFLLFTLSANAAASQIFSVIGPYTGNLSYTYAPSGAVGQGTLVLTNSTGAVPEPSSLLLMAGGLVTLGLFRRKARA